MHSTDTPLIWLDMEMTGLDPEACVPLQIARMVPVVRDMHTRNGLLEKVRTARATAADAERTVLEVVAAHVPPGAGLLCGSSIHHDRRFLVRHFAALHGYLHYRMVDVSSIKELVRRWYGPEAVYPKGTPPHTALADIRASIEELRYYRDRYMR